VVKLLLATGKVGVESKDTESGRTPQSWAARLPREGMEPWSSGFSLHPYTIKFSKRPYHPLPTASISLYISTDRLEYSFV
jgi:hypothetical protein